MNRKIIFRGWNNKYKRWDYVNNPMTDCVLIDQNSVGQYTGLKDKNGKMVYEGDILKTPRGFIGQVVFGRAEEECKHKVHGRTIIDRYTTYGWIFVRGDGYRCAIDDELLEGEIIDNVFCNPEILKGGEK